MLAKFSLFLCLYIQNGLNLFLLTANYMWLAKRKNSFLLLFASIMFIFVMKNERKQI